MARPVPAASWPPASRYQDYESVTPLATAQEVARRTAGLPPCGSVTSEPLPCQWTVTHISFPTLIRRLRRSAMPSFERQGVTDEGLTNSHGISM